MKLIIIFIWNFINSIVISIISIVGTVISGNLSSISPREYGKQKYNYGLTYGIDDFKKEDRYEKVIENKTLYDIKTRLIDELFEHPSEFNKMSLPLVDKNDPDNTIYTTVYQEISDMIINTVDEMIKSKESK